MTKKKRPTVEVGTVDLASFLALVNCATLGCAMLVAADVESNRETQQEMINLYRQSARALEIAGQKHWYVMMATLSKLGLQALEVNDVHGIRAVVTEIGGKPDRGLN